MYSVAGALSTSPWHLPFPCSAVSSLAVNSVALPEGASSCWTRLEVLRDFYHGGAALAQWLLGPGEPEPLLSHSLGGVTEACVLHCLLVFMSTIKWHLSMVVTCLKDLLMAILFSLSHFPTSPLKSPETTSK